MQYMLYIIKAKTQVLKGKAIDGVWWVHLIDYRCTVALRPSISNYVSCVAGPV